MVENLAYSNVGPFLVLEKYAAQGLFRKYAKGVFWFLKARLTEFYSQKIKLTFICFLSNAKLLLFIVNNGKIEEFTI